MLIGQHHTHPAADAFPLMDDEALKGLAEDIKVNGLRRPIVLIGETDEERILDGRNRYLACLLAKVEPLFDYFEGDPNDSLEIARYVCSHNLARRDLDLMQRALIARRLGKLIRLRKAREKVQRLLPGVTQVDHALETQMGDCSDDLQAAYSSGEITLRDAVTLSQMSHEEQRVALDEARKEEAEKPVKQEAPPRSMAIDLSLADLAAIRALVFAGEASAHGIVRAGAALIRKVVPGV